MPPSRASSALWETFRAEREPRPDWTPPDERAPLGFAGMNQRSPAREAGLLLVAFAATLALLGGAWALLTRSQAGTPGRSPASSGPTTPSSPTGSLIVP